MRRLIAISMAVLVAVLVALAAVPLSLSPDSLRDSVAERIGALSGYDVAVSGASELRLLPSPRFVLRDIRLRAPGVAQGAEVARIESLSGAVALLPLLAGRIEVAGVALKRPRLMLRVDETGRRNWVSARPGLVARTMADPASHPPEGVRLGDVRIEDGSLHYADARNGTRRTFDSIRATVSWADLAAPLGATGRLQWDADPVSFSFHADQPFAFLRRGSSAARISIRSPLANLSFDGAAHLTDMTHLRGRLALATSAAPRLLARLGADSGVGAGLEKLDLRGQISLLARTAILSDLDMSLDGNEAEGSLKLDLEDDRLGVQGTLAFESLDLDVYRGRSQADLETAAPSETVRTPIDLSDLDKTVADIRISARRVSLGALVLGETAGTLTIRDGALTLGIAQTALHGGYAMGTLSLAPARDGVVQARLNATLERVAIAGLLADLGTAARLEGNGDGWAKLTGQGRTLNDIVSRLSGRARLVISEGAVYGVDANAIEGLPAASARSAPEGDARTAFDRLSATLEIAEGVAETGDLQIIGPDLEIGIDAKIGLVSTSITGRGQAVLPAAGGALPFTIEGPVTAPRLRVDHTLLLDHLRMRPAGEPPGIAAEDLVDRVLEQLPAGAAP